MAEDICIDIGYESMNANEFPSIINEAFRLDRRISLMGLKVSKLDYITGHRRKTQPKIRCRNRKQNFITLKPTLPSSSQERKLLVMLMMVLGKTNELPEMSVNVFYKDASKGAISTKHKRGAIQTKFDDALNNDELFEQLKVSFNEYEDEDLTKIQNDLIALAVNNRIERDVAIQYCHYTNTTHEDLWCEFIDLKEDEQQYRDDLPQELNLPPMPFEEYMEAIEDILAVLCEDCLESTTSKN